MATTLLLLTTFLSEIILRIILKCILLIGVLNLHICCMLRCELLLPAMSLQKQISEDTWDTECSHLASCVSSGVTSNTHPMQKLYYRLGSSDSSCLEERCLIERYLELTCCVHLPMEDSRFVLNVGTSLTTQCFNN